MNQSTTDRKIKISFRLFLQDELTRRCRKNAKYSLRAFAESLEIDASSLSQIISGKRKASSKVIEHLSEKLKLSLEQKRLFLDAIKLRPKLKVVRAETEANYELIAEDTFKFISDWYHYAFTQLISVDGFKNSPAWVADMLGITVNQAHDCIERTIRLGVVFEESGRLYQRSEFITNFSPGQTSVARKNLQRQLIAKAIVAIDETSQDEKDITSMTMAIDPKRLPEARKLISQFRRDLCAYLGDGNQTQVYNLGVQLYPISKSILVPHSKSATKKDV